ncbi:MAG: ATP-binding protein, partial [Anaerolineae bacterium]|nr:ATP-binding protein [Anaerolineae bacterium]
KLHDQILGTLELDCRPTKLDQWLNQALIPWREAAQSKGLHWRADVPLTLPTLEIDPDRMAQVLGNLLSNAIKYTPSGGSVSVAAGSDEQTAWLRVSDTGAGLDEEEQKQIFEPFYRSQRTHRFPQGMGLGLTIALDLVVAHGGRLEVESEPEHGSRFTVWLPRGGVVN